MDGTRQKASSLLARQTTSGTQFTAHRDAISQGNASHLCETVPQSAASPFELLALYYGRTDIAKPAEQPGHIVFDSGNALSGRDGAEPGDLHMYQIEERHLPSSGQNCSRSPVDEPATTLPGSMPRSEQRLASSRSVASDEPLKWSNKLKFQVETLKKAWGSSFSKPGE